jgi:cell division protein ZapB
MTIRDLLFQFEQKVEHAIDLIELLRLQIEELEEENMTLRGEQEKWRDDLVNLIKRFDQIDSSSATSVTSQTSEDINV